MADIDSNRDVLTALDAVMFSETRRGLIVWTMRWTIGFTIIWATTAWTGRFDWLWWAGAAVAATSLAWTAWLRLVVARKITRLNHKLDELDDILAELPEID